MERHRGRREAGARLGAEVGRAVLQRQALDERAQLLGIADVEDGRLGAALGLDALEVGDDLVERLLPRDRRELAGAAGPDAPQRREQPVLVVDVLAGRGALGAERAAAVRVLARALDLDDAAVAHGEVEAALGSGVADGADRLAHFDPRVGAGELGLQTAFGSVHVLPSLPPRARRPRSRGAPAAGWRATRPSAPASSPARRTSPSRLKPTSRRPEKPSTATAPARSSTSSGSAAAREPPLANSSSPACWMLQGRPGARRAQPGHRETGRPSLPARARPQGTTRRSPLTGSSGAGDVAGGEQPGRGGAAAVVDVEGSAGREATRFEQAEVGARSGADDDQVEGLRAGLERHQQAPVVTLDEARRHAEPEIEAAGAEAPLDDLGARRVRHTGQHRGLGLDDGDLEPQPAQDARGLDAGERRAKDQRARRDSAGRAHLRGRDGAAQQHGVVERAKDEDAGAGRGRAPAGRPSTPPWRPGTGRTRSAPRSQWPAGEPPDRCARPEWPHGSAPGADVEGSSPNGKQRRPPIAPET